ncbi:hypothetical protein H0H93_005228 [Arthromyces matolae]|nr:hypothetical protein H0H93_005228 [Arthromyces matolae]
MFRPSKSKLRDKMDAALEAIDSIPEVLDQHGNDITSIAREEAKRTIRNRANASGAAIDNLPNLDPFQRYLFKQTVKNFVSESQQAKLDIYDVIEQGIAQTTIAKYGPRLATLEADPSTPPAVKATITSMRTSLEGTRHSAPGPSSIGQPIMSPEETLILAQRVVFDPQSAQARVHEKSMPPTQTTYPGHNLQGVHGPTSLQQVYGQPLPPTQRGYYPQGAYAPPIQPGTQYHHNDPQQEFPSLPAPPRGHVARPQILRGNEQGSPWVITQSPPSPNREPPPLSLCLSFTLFTEASRTIVPPTTLRSLMAHVLLAKVKVAPEVTLLGARTLQVPILGAPPKDTKHDDLPISKTTPSVLLSIRSHYHL